MRDFNDRSCPPLTIYMMQIASHPDDPWLQKYIDKHNGGKKSARALMMPDVPEEVYDAQDAQNDLIKHLATRSAENN